MGAFAWIVLGLSAAVTTATPAIAAANQSPKEEVVRLYPGQAPGTEDWTGDEVHRTDPKGVGGEVHIVTNVTVPSFTVVRPMPGKANGTGMLVLPGGGFGVLAWDIEGTEVARWLADRGITAFILKYRVGAPKLAPDAKPISDIASILRLMEPRRKFAVADASQAIRLIRKDAARYRVRPDRIGMIGFSAGAITTMGVILEGDAAVRPNLAAAIYGLMMVENPKVPADAPPVFVAAAQDDWIGVRGTEIFDLWTKAKRPAEIHIYQKGGHGFGIRPKLPASHWAKDFEIWLGSQGFLTEQATTIAR